MTDDTATTADTLRSIADVLDADSTLTTDKPMTIYVTTAGRDRARALFTALRAAYPSATVSPAEYYSQLVLPGLRIAFNNNDLGEKRTVTREVEEYVFDPALDLAPVSAR